MPDHPMTAEQRRRLFALANRLGLDRSERHHLAEMILRRDDPSWARLSRRDARRLTDALEGFAYVQALILQRGPR